MTTLKDTVGDLLNNQQLPIEEGAGRHDRPSSREAGMTTPKAEHGTSVEAP